MKVERIDDGGAAFPRTGHTDGIESTEHEGMSLRDHFAGLAMQAFASNPQMAIGIRDTAEQAGITPPEMMACTAYRLADAMIYERNRTGGG